MNHVITGDRVPVMESFPAGCADHGGGTTAVAVIESGRRFIGVERNPEYAELARDRLSQLGQGAA